MSLTYGFYNSVDGDRMYNAEDMGSIFTGLIRDGVYKFGDEFIVTAYNGMTLKIGSGRAWFNDTWTYNSNGYSITIPEAPSNNKRIDAIILVVDKRLDERRNYFKIISGSVAPSPVKPTIVDEDSIFYHVLAYVTVSANVTTITAENIEQAVGTSVCPYAVVLSENVNFDVLDIQHGGTGNKNGYIQTGIKADESVTESQKCTIEGYYNSVQSAKYAHAEGYSCTASGYSSHAEGENCTASMTYSHAEGGYCTAAGSYSHAEGGNCTASGSYSHAEGNGCVTNRESSHAEGSGCSALKQAAHAEGNSTTANGKSSHAEGDMCNANANYSHAEGHDCTVSSNGTAGHAEGYGCTVSSDVGSHAEGYLTTASGGNGAHAEGYQTTASGDSAHAEGYGGIASGNQSHVEGYNNKASGYYSHAEGYDNTASGNYSHAAGRKNTAYLYQTVVGSCNKEYGADTSYTANSGYFIVGCGNDTAVANCLRATESYTYGKSYQTSGADYAEMFEWLDGNPDNIDRIGHFVTLDGSKIRLANSYDDYILGIVSAKASVVGDDGDEWHGMYTSDIYGRHKYVKVKIDAEYDDDGNEIVPESYVDTLEISDDYDPELEYVHRKDRKEWDAIGLLGKIVCVDDGSAEVNGFVRPNRDGVATKSDVPTKFRVMGRLDEVHIKVMIL